MSTRDEIQALKEQVERLQQMLGIQAQPAPECAVQPDYIELGSKEHADFLGLVIVTEDDDTTGFTLFESRVTDVTYRLADELQATQHYPGMDPEKAILLLLRSKVSSLESGPPAVDPSAPSLWVPVDENMTPV